MATLLFRAPGAITTPVRSKAILPDLGLPLVARYNANATDGAEGAVLTSLTDLTGNAHNTVKLSSSFTDPTIATFGGKRVFDFSVGTSYHTTPGFTQGKARTIAMAGYMAGVPTTNYQFFVTENGGAAMTLLPTTGGTDAGKLALYPGSGMGAYPKTAPPTLPGWFTFIAAINAAGTEIKIALNGVITTAVATATWTPASNPIQIKGDSTNIAQSRFVDLAVCSAYPTDAQIATMHAALKRQIP